MTKEITEQRRKSIEGLRALADFLESNPSLPVPSSQHLNVPLMTNAPVEEFAAAQGLDVEYDDEGNASADVKFGPLTYHVYGYTDFDAHCELDAERRAKSWAKRKGLELRAAEQVSA
ncbi:hypothetical protein ACFVGN_38570 [Streptomyces sp. NPDC057757]|uniref:hypothetical protein n=1 Tax=Streptomyces sp. NPDC057757 TaxID=3346241 RepID=UPI0036B7A538